MRRVRALCVTVVVTAIAAGCSGHGGDHVAKALTTTSSTGVPIVVSTAASPVDVATEIRRAVLDAHLVAPVLFDGHTLRLDVAHDSSRVDEAHAIALFRAGSPPWTIVENVTVAYADATLRLPVT